MHLLRHLSLSSRLLLGLMAVAAGVGVGGEVLRPGHHIHLGAGGHHHHWHVGPHTHGENEARELASEVPGTSADAHHHDLPGDDGPPPNENADGAFVDAFPLEKAASYVVLGTSQVEDGASLQSALPKRATTPPFLPITPRGPPPGLLFV